MQEKELGSGSPAFARGARAWADLRRERRSRGGDSRSGHRHRQPDYPLLSLFVMADLDPRLVWAHWIARMEHDLLALWSVAFWLWTIAAAYQQAKATGR